MPSWGWWEYGLDGAPARLSMGQDLDYNHVIVYFTTDDLIGFSPFIVSKREEDEGSGVCVAFARVSPRMRVRTWALV